MRSADVGGSRALNQSISPQSKRMRAPLMDAATNVLSYIQHTTYDEAR